MQNSVNHRIFERILRLRLRPRACLSERRFLSSPPPLTPCVCVWGSRWSWRVRWRGGALAPRLTAGPLKYEALACSDRRRGAADRCGGPVMGTHHWRCGSCDRRAGGTKRASHATSNRGRRSGSSCCCCCARPHPTPLTSDQTRLPAELKHITKRRKRN